MPDASDLDVAAYALAHGLTAEQYHAMWRDGLSRPFAGLSVDDRRMIAYARLNLERSRKVTEQIVPSERLASALRRLPEGQTWVVITEDWCFDSSFSLPSIEDAAARAPSVTLRILPRDAHLEIMDRYLINGGRAIPRLVAFDADGAEAWTWGPRTETGRAFRQACVDDGMDKNAITAALVAWYEQGGWCDVDTELAECIEGQLGS